MLRQKRVSILLLAVAVVFTAAAALMHENVGGGDVALDIAVHLELTAVANLTLDRGVFPDDQHACVTHGQPPLLAGRPAPFHLTGADAA